MTTSRSNTRSRANPFSGASDGTSAAPAVKPAGRARTTRTADAAGAPQASDVLTELKSLAKELNKAAKGLDKAVNAKPREVSSILGSVERMTMDAANKSLHEAELAKQVVAELRASLGKDWSRQQLENGLQAISGHLTNIIVAQEFQDLAGQSIRKAMKALVGAIVVEAGGPTDEGRLTQAEADALLRELIP